MFRQHPHWGDSRILPHSQAAASEGADPAAPHANHKQIQELLKATIGAPQSRHFLPPLARFASVFGAPSV
jgi:hypothetical protein